MLYEIVEEHFDGAVKVISTTAFPDSRGFYTIPFREDEFSALGLPTNFVQDNYSRSIKNVVRGLHFQLNPPMGKLMRVTSGRAFLVAVDLRQDSPTFLQWIGTEVSEYNRLQVWAPAGFARGFCALEDNTVVQYKTTGFFDSKGDSTILWNDPSIGINWPVSEPILSDKDRNARTVVDCFDDSAKLSSDNRVIQSMWIGSVSLMEKMCVKSFLDNGHEFHLYTYGPLDVVLPGVIIKDANEIVPKSRMDEFELLQQAADYFRYALLRKKGGWWVDMDTICLKPFNFPEKYVFVTNTPDILFNGFIKVSAAGSPIMRSICYEIDKLQGAALKGIDYQAVGPKLLTEKVREFGLRSYERPRNLFDPVGWDNLKSLIDPKVNHDLRGVYAVHLSRSVWNSGPSAANCPIKLNIDSEYPKGCLYEKLKAGFNSPLGFRSQKITEPILPISQAMVGTVKTFTAVSSVRRPPQKNSLVIDWWDTHPRG